MSILRDANYLSQMAKQLGISDSIEEDVARQILSEVEKTMRLIIYVRHYYKSNEFMHPSYFSFLSNLYFKQICQFVAYFNFLPTPLPHLMILRMLTSFSCNSQDKKWKRLMWSVLWMQRESHRYYKSLKDLVQKLQILITKILNNE